MNVLKRIHELRAKRGWTEYRLSEESGIAQSTISSWFRKGILPSVGSIENLCRAFGITLAEFFTEDGSPIVLTSRQSEVLDYFSRLNEEQQERLLFFLRTI